MYAIEINHLSKSYGKSRGIVDVSINVNEGEIFGFIGPNGAGKSTTIRTLLNYIHKDSGSASIMGLDCERDSKKIKEIVGYLPSEVNYYDDMSIKNLLEYSAGFYKKDCAKRIKELTERFEIDTSKKFHSLSLGNKKKVAIVQALIHEPEVLILDEPTSGLDPLMQERFFDTLKEENKKGTAIFFSSHILSEVEKMCRRVAVIKEGKVLQISEISKIRSRSFKNVKIELYEKLKEDFNIDGAKNLLSEGNVIKFLYKGDVNKLISELSLMNIKDVEIEEPSLEEIFMHYYEKEAK